MKLARLALAYLAGRPLLTALNVTMLALGVGTIAFLLLVTHQAEDRLSRDAKPVDLVVGAKGSPLQLILSTVFHADVPTGNIGVAEAEAIVANPMVAAATPLALGDSFRGHRIVGTDASFLGLYEAKLASGRLFAGEMEAVIGSEVARRHALAVGASITGSHGLAQAGPAHGDHPYKVTGVLAPTGRADTTGRRGSGITAIGRAPSHRPGPGRRPGRGSAPPAAGRRRRVSRT